MPLELNINILFIILVILNLSITIIVCEVCLKLLNRINNVNSLIAGRTLFAAIILGLIYMVLESTIYFASSASDEEKQNPILACFVLMLIYLFKYFFPRQRGVSELKNKEKNDMNNKEDV